MKLKTLIFLTVAAALQGCAVARIPIKVIDTTTDIIDTAADVVTE